MTSEAQQKLDEIERPDTNPTQKENEGNHLAIISARSWLLWKRGEISEEEYRLIETGVNIQKDFLWKEQ